MATLINNILDTTALEAGKMDVSLEPVNLQELVQSAIETVRPLILKNGNQLEHEFAGKEVAVVDRTKLQQILLNLLTNAKPVPLQSGPEGRQLSAHAVFISIAAHRGPRVEPVVGCAPRCLRCTRTAHRIHRDRSEAFSAFPRADRIRSP